MDIPWVTITSKSNAIRLRRQMEPIATLELQHRHVQVTDYCGCEGIKETTICKTHCKTSPFPTRVHVDRFVGKESNLGASESACKIG